MSALLSGEQLVHASSKTKQELPAGGLKEFQPTNSWLEKKQIQSALDQRKDLLEEERVEKWSWLMKAEWLPDKSKAVVKQKTKSWEVFGHNSDNTDWLFSEEVVFLLELNCLECTYNEVPLSIQKAFSVVLGERNGCSLTEYRVYSHLSRLGYRLTRHLPDLTVTAYEKQIRLDCHIDQRAKYDNKPSDSALPDITYDNVNADKIPAGISGNADAPGTIEIIDIADSSEESSESESDSDIEVVYETTGPAEVAEGITEISDSEDEEDIDVVEVPIPPKQIEVATIESSESENEDEHSGSESERSYDGNWKRSSGRKKKYVRPSTMSNLTYLAVEEFCKEPKMKNLEMNQVNEFSEGQITNCSNSDSITTSNIDSLSANQRHNFRVERPRNSILDLIPSMMGSKNKKLMTVECPDSRLIPENVTPKQKTYTFNTNTLRAKYFDPTRFANRGRRNFNSTRFNSSNFPQNSTSGVFPYQIPILQMLNGSDVHSMARGLMQMASTILSNSQAISHSSSNSYHSPNGYNNISNNGPPFPIRGFNSLPFIRNDHRHRYPETQHRDSYRFHQNNFQNNQPNQIVPRFGTHQIQPSRNFGHHIYFDNPPPTGNFLANDNYPTPPILSEINLAVQRSHSRSPISRTHSNSREFSPSTSSHNGFNSFPALDPAYIKSDVPVQGFQNTRMQEDGSFISLRSKDRKPIEIVEINNDDVPKIGVSGRYNRKRRRKQQVQMAKRLRANQNIKTGPIEIVFLDSPDPSSQSENSMSSSVKQEDNNSSHGSIKTETDQEIPIKQESSTGTSKQQFEIKEETPGPVKCENDVVNTSQTLLKQEEDSGIRVTLDSSGANICVEIKIENQNNTSSVSSIPLESVVKSESTSEVKSEPTEIRSDIVKTEDLSSVSTSIKDESSVDDLPDENQSSSLDTNGALRGNNPNPNSLLDTTATSIATDTDNTMNNVSEIETDNRDERLNPSEATETIRSHPTTADSSQDNQEAAISTTSLTLGDEESSKIAKQVVTDEVPQSQAEVVTSTEQNIINNSKNNSEGDISTEKVTSSQENSTSDCNEQDKEVCEMEIDISDIDSQTQESNQRSRDISSVEEGAGEAGDHGKADISTENITSSLENNTGDCSRLDKDVCEMEVEIADIETQTKESNQGETSSMEESTGEMSNRSSWAQIKMNRETTQPSKPQEDVTSDEDEDDVVPLIRTKHCKTLGTVLSRLQIFAPFSPEVPSDLLKLKISFDLYLPTTFRKSHRGLPHFRISVFEGGEMLPSAAQLHELQHRFSDGVSVLCAVVMPGSVVFYSCSDISLPVDITSYTSA